MDQPVQDVPSQRMPCRQGRVFEVLGAAYAANGDFRAASAQQRIAVRKAQSLGWNTRFMTQRLAAYRDGRPWRGDLLALPPAGSHAN